MSRPRANSLAWSVIDFRKHVCERDSPRSLELMHQKRSSYSIVGGRIDAKRQTVTGIQAMSSILRRGIYHFPALYDLAARQWKGKVILMTLTWWRLCSRRCACCTIVDVYVSTCARACVYACTCARMCAKNINHDYMAKLRERNCAIYEAISHKLEICKSIRDRLCQRIFSG